MDSAFIGGAADDDDRDRDSMDGTDWSGVCVPFVFSSGFVAVALIAYNTVELSDHIAENTI